MPDSSRKYIAGVSALIQRAREWLANLDHPGNGTGALIRDLLAAVEAVDVRTEPRVRELVAAWEEWLRQSHIQMVSPSGVRLAAAIDALRLPATPKIPDTAKKTRPVCYERNCALSHWHTVAEHPPSPSDSERIELDITALKPTSWTVLQLESQHERIAALEQQLQTLANDMSKHIDGMTKSLVNADSQQTDRIAALESRLTEMERDWRAANVAPRLDNIHTRLDNLESTPPPSPPNLEWSEWSEAEMSFAEAEKWIASKGDRWRMPTKKEYALPECPVAVFDTDDARYPELLLHAVACREVK